MKLTQITKFIVSVLICSVIVVVSSFFNADEGFADAAEGQKLFKKYCLACHAIDDQNRVGPSLIGVFGRSAGSLQSYRNYSQAMQTSDLIWDQETLNVYLTSPQKLVPRTKMSFVGVTNTADRESLISYLKTLK